MSTPTRTPPGAFPEIKPAVIKQRVKKLPPLPLELPGELHDKLAGLRRRRRSVAIYQAVIILASSLGLLWLVQGVADWFLFLPWVVRALLFVGDGVALTWIYRRYFPSVFRRDPSLAGVALVVENRWPELRQCLISAVELAEGKPGTTRGSYRLALEVIAEARWKTQSLDFFELVPWRTFRLWLVLGWVVAVGTISAMNSAWPISGILLERILLFPVTQTTVIPITRDIAAPLGSDVLMSARATGRIPTGGYVTVAYKSQSAQDLPVVPDASQPDTFSLTLQNVQKPFTYQFHLNDGESPRFTVDAEVPPALASLEFKVVYPGYTGLAPELRAPGNLSVLAGSQLHIIATATQNLRSATICLTGTLTPQTIEMTPDATGKTFQGGIFIPVKDLTGFSIHLVNASGFPSANETVYPVYPVPDLPPVVKMSEPAEERETIVAQAKPVFVVDVSDDYGIAKLSLHYRCIPPGTHGQPGQAEPVQEVSLPFDPGRTAQVEYTLDVAAQVPAWQEGEAVDYWVEAMDNNTVTGPGVTSTKTRHFEVVSLAEKEREISERLQQASNSLDTVAGEQDKVANKVSDGIHH